MLKQMAFTAGEGKYQVQLLVTVTGDGLIVQLFGGTRPHVGAVALSQPRPGLSDPDRISCNTAIIPLLGHKDDEVAKPVAEEIARACGRPVVVVAGVHVDGAAAGDIEQLVDNCFAAAKKLVREIEVREIGGTRK